MVLTNIYNPKVLPPKPTSTTQPSTNTRHTLPTIHISLTPLKKSSTSSLGSCLLEIGQTKVLASIEGPHSLSQTPSGSGGGEQIDRNTYVDKGGLNVTIKYAAFAKRVMAGGSSSGGGSSHNTNMKMNEEERELAVRVSNAIRPSILLQKLKKQVLSLSLSILQDDGMIFSSLVIASSLALASAGVDLLDLVASCVVGVAETSSSNDDNQSIVTLAPTAATSLQSSLTADSYSTITLSLLPNQNKTTSFEIVGGSTSVNGIVEGTEICRTAIASVHKLMREALIRKAEEEANAASLDDEL